jgi:Papain family cysteine protease
MGESRCAARGSPPFRYDLGLRLGTGSPTASAGLPARRIFASTLLFPDLIWLRIIPLRALLACLISILFDLQRENSMFQAQSFWSRIARVFMLAAVSLGAAVASAVVATAQQSVPPRTIPLVYQQRLQNASPEVKARLEALEQRAVREKWRFRPVYTSALDRPLSQLTGAKPGGPSQTVARARQDSAKDALESYAREKRRLGIPEGKAACNPQAAAFDWRSHNMISPVQNQYSCGSCWAFAAVAVLESGHLIENGKQLDASEQHLLNCTRDSDCVEGYLDYALDYLVSDGTTLRADEPYTAVKANSCPIPSTPVHRLVTSAMIESDWTQVVAPEKIKDALCEHGPVATRLIVTDAFGSVGDDVFHQVDSDLTVFSPNAHFLAIVGWDDKRGAHGAWLIKNSWGDTWGDQGFAWIEYGANLIGHETIWVQVAHEKVVAASSSSK